MSAWSAPVAISDTDLRFLGERMGCDFTSGPRRAYLDRWDTCDVQAAPGSGKTTLLVAKLVHLARNWPFQQQGVCVLSHTNVARYEIEEGVAKIPEAARLLAYPNFIGTLTRFFHTFLALPLLRGLGWPMTRVDDDMFAARVCALLRTKPTLRKTPKVKERTLREWASKLTLTADFDACEGGPPAQLQVEEQPGLYGRHSDTRRELEELKAELCANGIFRFADMTALARRALQLAPDLARRIATRFPLVILDEAQDTSASHLQLVEQVFGGGRAALQRIGDCNQAILGGDDSGGVAWTPGANPIDLGESLRFGSGIARFASKITYRRKQTIDGKGSAHDWPPHVMLVSNGSEVSVGKRFAELVASKFTESMPLDVWAVGWIHKPSKSKRAVRLGSYFTSYEPPQRSADHAKTLLGALQEELARPSAAYGRELAEVVDVYARYLRILLAVQVPRTELPSITRIWRWLEDARPGSAREARLILLRIVELSGSVSASEWPSLTKRLRDALDPALPRTAKSTTIDSLLSYAESERSDDAEAVRAGDEEAEIHNIDGRTIRVQVGTIASVKGSDTRCDAPRRNDEGERQGRTQRSRDSRDRIIRPPGAASGGAPGSYERLRGSHPTSPPAVPRGTKGQVRGEAAPCARGAGLGHHRGTLTPHPIQRRYLAEDLVRVRPADEQRRYVASQRSGRIDPNPHQVEAVIFALKRIPEGGCILADEVGLGKTIEAGLVLAQLLAEGASRVLIISPKALLGQWRQELFTLFSITATEYAPGVDLAVPGVFLVTRDFAGGEAGAEALSGVPRFDLCVIDEAHEIFAAIYKRYDRSGAYLEDSDKAKMAGRVRSLLLDTPVLLLTATPIQNSLTELWGLAQLVEPTGTLLGNLATFREMFTAGDDRRLAEGQEHELQKRVAEICQRTLRRQAQEFMERPFVGRRTQLVPYSMSPEEQALYDEVTDYLLQPGICAFRGNQRRLLLIGFHRRMASSLPALAASLEKVAARLEKMLTGSPAALDEEETASELLDDLEEDERLAEDVVVDQGQLPLPEVMRAELERVRSYARRARELPSDAKARALIRAVKMVLDRRARGEGSGRVVVFTESITTQNYLRQVLRESGLLDDGEITLFRGVNDGPRALEALERWAAEELAHLPRTAHPSKEIAIRLALVHEFRTRSKVFISTEAGAKGLNLQFAGTLINYDLPWNPQRIEQRIGRIHRYGQEKDVLVINFAAEGNAAQQLTLEILGQKLDLFGTVLGASDEVLHQPTTDSPETLAGALGADFETRLRRIYERARTRDEIEAELVALRESIGEERERFERTHARTASLIESRFDEQVKKVFRRIQDALPDELAAFDRDLERVVTGYLSAIGARWERTAVQAGVRLAVEPCTLLPEELCEGFTAHLGDARGAGEVEPLHLGHPLVHAALEEARAATASQLALCLRTPDGMRPGARGRLRLVKVRYAGYEPAEELVPVAVLEGTPSPLDREQARALLSAPANDLDALDVDVSDEELADALEEILFDAEEEVARREQERFSRAVQQIETSIEDRVLLLERRRADALDRVTEAEFRRDAAVGADARGRADAALEKAETKLEQIEADLDRLRRREDDEYARWMERAHERRSKPPTVETLFDVRFALVGGDA